MQPHDDIDDQDDLRDDQPAQDDNRPTGGWAGWAVSGAIHAGVLCGLTLVGFAVTRPSEDPPGTPVQMTAQLPPADKPPVLERNDPDLPVIPISMVSDVVAPKDLLMPVEKADLAEADPVDGDPPGDPNKISTMEMGQAGFMPAIGPGGGAPGPFGKRGPSGRKRGAAEGGGNGRSEAAVEGALRWLKRHQSPDGRWEAVNYGRNCQEDGPRCEPGNAQAGDADVALTGLAALCFLGAGHDHKAPGTYRNVVRQAVDHLVAVQQGDGLIGKRNYEHAVAAMALAEAYGMTNDPELREPAQKAMDVITARQAVDPAVTDATYGRLAWDYGNANAARNDSSVSGWCIMALKSGRAAGLDVSTALDGAKHWVTRTWEVTNPDHAKLDTYTGESRFPYVFNATAGTVDIAKTPGDSHDLAGVGLVSAIFLGHGTGDVMAETLANYVTAHQAPTAWKDMNLYYVYYGSLGMFQLGSGAKDPRWQRWNTTVRDLLVDNQRSGDGCFAGSWNWDDSRKFHGADTGRVLSTTLSCLTLEVYYRYALVMNDKAALKRMQRGAH
jgi:hypothetical protein